MYIFFKVWFDTCNKMLLSGLWCRFLDLAVCIYWLIHFNELFKLDKIETKRHVLCCGKQEIELHGFCDASTLAYGSVVYVRSVCKHGVKVCLWTAKSCVAPAKVHTVPRLELMGSVLLSKLVVSVKLAVEKMLKALWEASLDLSLEFIWSLLSAKNSKLGAQKLFVILILKSCCGGWSWFGRIGSCGLKTECKLFEKMQHLRIGFMCRQTEILPT